MSNDKRNSEDEMTDLDTNTEGVGGRQEDPALPRGGGGYLDICIKNAAAVQQKNDPRLKELETMRLGPLWLQLANTIGYDAFLVAWSILDGNNYKVPPKLRSQNRVRIPRFSMFMRYQRNRLILSLADEQKTPSEIQLIIKKKLREEITTIHISRIIKKYRVQE